MHGDVLRSLDTQTNLRAVQGQHGHDNVGADLDRLMGVAGQYQHGDLLLRLWRGKHRKLKSNDLKRSLQARAALEPKRRLRGNCFHQVVPDLIESLTRQGLVPFGFRAR